MSILAYKGSQVKSFVNGELCGDVAAIPAILGALRRVVLRINAAAPKRSWGFWCDLRLNIEITLQKGLYAGFSEDTRKGFMLASPKTPRMQPDREQFLVVNISTERLSVPGLLGALRPGESRISRHGARDRLAEYSTTYDYLVAGKIVIKRYIDGILVNTFDASNADQILQARLIDGTGGSSGYSGTSGYSGATGAAGATGAGGSQGSSGYSGYSGGAGATGPTGAQGVSGFSGFSGLSGISGYSGTSGISGISGFSGYSGISGFSGYSGRSGYSGVAGTSGYSGATVTSAAVVLTDGATLSNIDTVIADYFHVTIADNRTVPAPLNPIARRRFVLAIKQDGTGSHTLTWNAVFRFSGGTAPTLTTTADKTDFVAAIYNAVDSKWDAFVMGQNF